MLGVWLDSRLALTDQMDMVCSKLMDGTRSLVRSMNDLGFGLPFQRVQLKQRVWASALHGAEVLASFGPGWKQAVKRLNDIHYAMAKIILGLPANESLGAGGHVRAFSETRFLTRLGGELAQRVVLARVRILLLPPGNPVEAVLRGVAQVPGKCWLRDVEVIMDELEITNDLGVNWEEQDRSCKIVTKLRIKRWKHNVVIPAVRRAEDEWFRRQLAALNEEGLIPYAELVPLRMPWPAVFRWAPWGKTMWRYHRAWCLARISSGIPLVSWGRNGIQTQLACCSLCGLPRVDLRHILAECPGLLVQRAVLQPGVLELLPRWALEIGTDLEDLGCRVRYFGVCVGAVVCNLPRGG